MPRRSEGGRNAICFLNKTDDLEVAGMLAMFHQSTPHLLLIFESGEQQILGLASFFANLDQVFLLQN